MIDAPGPVFDLLAAVARRARLDLSDGEPCPITHDGGRHAVTECATDYLDWLRSMRERSAGTIANRMLEQAA